MAVSIVFVLPSLKSGGGNRVFIELANRLIIEDYQTTIVYPNNSKSESHYNLDHNVKLLKIGRFALSNFQKLINVFLLFRFLNQTLKSNPNAKIIISDPIITALSFLVNKKYSRRILRFVQADDYRLFDDLFLFKNKLILKFYKKICLKIYKRNYIYIFNSKFTFQKFVELSKKNIKLNIVHPGVDHNIFKSINLKPKAELNISLFGRIHPMKGFQDFIKAWNLLSNEVKSLVSNIYIISHDDLSKFDTTDYKIFIPKSDNDIVSILNSSHIFVSTSWWEGFGLPPLEAMACGCAVISSDSGGIREFGINNKNCLIYEPQNFKELAEKLSILIQDESLRFNLSKNASMDSLKFNWVNSGKQLIDVISQIN